MSSLFYAIDVHALGKGILKGMAAPLFVCAQRSEGGEAGVDFVQVELPKSFELQPMEADWLRVGSDIELALSKYEQKQQSARSR